MGLFWDMFARYDVDLQNVQTISGIAPSWFECWSELRKRRNSSKVVLISYGVDTRKIVLNTVADEQCVVQIAINFGMWGEKDANAFKALFAEEEAVTRTSRVGSKQSTGGGDAKV